MLLCSCKTATLFWDGGEFLKIDDTVRQKNFRAPEKVWDRYVNNFWRRPTGCAKCRKYTPFCILLTREVHFG